MATVTMSAARVVSVRAQAPKRGPTALKATKGGKAAVNEGKEYMLALPGITGPLGFWDPLGFTDAPTFNVSEAKRLREVEVTHGRVSMLAAVGWIVAEEWHPLFGGQIGGAAFGHFQEIEEIFPQFWEIVVLVLGILETNRARVIYSGVNTTTANKMNPDYTPGELGFDPLGLFPEDAAAAAELQTKELNNGRLAMVSIIGFMMQEEFPFTGIEAKVTIWKGLVEDNIIPPEDAGLLPY